METKVCTKCGRELPLEAFGVRTASKDGLQYYCKECANTLRASQRVKAIDRAKHQGLMSYTPRELMEALYKMGYRGKLTYTEVKTIDLSTIME